MLLATAALPLAPVITAALQGRDLLFTERIGSAWRAAAWRRAGTVNIGTVAPAEG